MTGHPDLPASAALGRLIVPGSAHQAAGTGRTEPLAGPDGPAAAGDSFTYRHASYPAGQHWFSAEHDGDEAGHAHVAEHAGSGRPYAVVRELWTGPHYRRRGIGSRLLGEVAGHFTGYEVRLKPYPTGEDGDPGEDELRSYYSNRGFGDYERKDDEPFELDEYMSRPAWPPGNTLHSAHGEPTGLAEAPVYLHGGPNRVEPGGFIHQDAMPRSHGRSAHNFFTTSREVAEDAADMRDGLGHGWVHTVEPAGSFEADGGEPQSWKSAAPLRVISVEPDRRNGGTPHPPVLREPPAPDGTAASLGHLYHSTPYPGGFPHDEWTHAGTVAAALNRITRTNPADYGLPPGTPATLHTIRLRGRIYPRTLSNDQADGIWGAGHLGGLEKDGLPIGEGHHVFPYRNDTDDEGSISYLVHRSAIVAVHAETIPRPGRPPPQAAGAHHADPGQEPAAGEGHTQASAGPPAPVHPLSPGLAAPTEAAGGPWLARASFPATPAGLVTAPARALREPVRQSPRRGRRQ